MLHNISFSVSFHFQIHFQNSQTCLSLVVFGFHVGSTRYSLSRKEQVFSTDFFLGVSSLKIRQGAIYSKKTYIKTIYSPNHFQKIGGFVVLLQAPNLFTQKSLSPTDSPKKVCCLKKLNHFLGWFSQGDRKGPWGGWNLGDHPGHGKISWCFLQGNPGLSGQGYSCEEIELTELLPKARSSISGHSSSGYFFFGGGVSFCGGISFFGITRFFRKERRKLHSFEGKLTSWWPFSTFVMGRRVSLVNLLNSENLPDAPKCQTNKATGLKNSELVHLCTSYPSLWEKKTMHPLGCIKAWERIPTPGWWIFFSFWVCFGHFCCTWSKNQLILNLLCGFVGSQFIANSFQKQRRHDELTQGSEKIIRLPILEGSNLMQTYGKFLSFKNVLFGVVSHNDCMWVEKPMRPRPRPDIFSDGWRSKGKHI